MILKGFKFGMILQLAIGPISLFVLVCGRNGFIYAEKAAIAVTIIDSLFIILAVLGITSFLNSEKLKRLFMLIGAAIIMLFGVSTILGVFGQAIIPAFNISNTTNSHDPFLYGLLLTAANPLTILFWAGVFTAKAVEENYKSKDLIWFAIGSASSTLVCMTFVAILGSLVISSIPEMLVSGLNVVVGIVLIYFAIRLIMRKV
jgi:arginine exporter protein ArgO